MNDQIYKEPSILHFILPCKIRTRDRLNHFMLLFFILNLKQAYYYKSVKFCTLIESGRIRTVQFQMVPVLRKQKTLTSLLLMLLVNIEVLMYNLRRCLH